MPTHLSAAVFRDSRAARLRPARGFTLIELVIVMLVVSVLAAIAIPSYSAYIVRTKRSAAKSALMTAANLLERNRTAFGCYNKTTLAACQSQAAGNDFALSVNTAPEQSGSYILTFPALTATTYTMLATPCGTAGTCPAGSDTGFVDAECGVFGITESTVRSTTGTAPVDRCWER